MYPENPRSDPSNRRLYEHGIWYISDTARNRNHNLFYPKCTPIPLGHRDELCIRWSFVVIGQLLWCPLFVIALLWLVSCCDWSVVVIGQLLWLVSCCDWSQFCFTLYIRTKLLCAIDLLHTNPYYYSKSVGHIHQDLNISVVYSVCFVKCHRSTLPTLITRADESIATTDQSFLWEYTNS